MENELPKKEPIENELPIQNEENKIEKEESPHLFKFFGEGSQLFGVIIINFILTVVTFGIYYPWAKAKRIRFFYNNTEFAGSRFSFHGTGKEMFIGFLKLIGLGIIVGGFGSFLMYQKQFALIFILYVLSILVIVPLALTGTLKYRMSRTSWRGIYFGYRGDFMELAKIWVPGILLTIITLGIYWQWLKVDMRKYITDKLRFGNVEAEYRGNGSDLFFLAMRYGVFIGLIAMVFNLGIKNIGTQINPNTATIILSIFAFILLAAAYFILYSLYTQEVFNYNAEKTVIWQNQKEHYVHINPTKTEIVTFALTNIAIIIFTLGIGTSWAIVNYFKFMTKHMSMDGDFNLDELHQTESQNKDALGEGLADWIDIDIA